jgi:lipopolysaccharide exporter
VADGLQSAEAPASPRPAIAGRLDPGIHSLRRHAARGSMVNAGFQIGLAGLGTVQRIAVAAFLTREEFGIWGIVLSIIVTLGWLKQIGVADKYIQQNEPDQEAAFQKAFTLEMLVSAVYLALVLAVIPIYTIVYGRSDIVLPAIALAMYIPLSGLESPAWIAYRRLQYGRQRTLTAVGAAGLGYWCLVIGVLAGGVAGATVCLVTCPYRIRLRFDRRTLSEYATFSWPLVGVGVTRLVVVQGALIAAKYSAGLGAIGSIAVAVSVALLADRIDQIVSQTIYPAICAIADRMDVLHEAFVKSNRLALIWAMPFATAAALFAHDLTHYVLGARWDPAAPLMAVLALSSGVAQVAFNWTVFMRAINQTKPMFVSALVDLAVFLAVTLPAILALGLTGYAIGAVTTMLGQLAVRSWYLRRLFRGFSVLWQLARAVAPTIPAAAVVLAVRAVEPDGRSLPRALAELALFAAVAVACTYFFERGLVREMLSYLGRGRDAAAVAAKPPAAGAAS